MRFIIHELAFEERIASGTFRYFRDGQETGAVETWRLNDASGGYRFLRVDLDARAAPSGHSYLYHLTLDHLGQAVQLKFRFWGSNLEIIGSVLIEEDALIVTRDIKGRRIENVFSTSEKHLFFYPSTLGLGLLAEAPVGKNQKAVAFQSQSEIAEEQMSPYITDLLVSRGEYEEITVMNELMITCPITISWANQQRKIWVDKNNWPLRMERNDGLSSVETQYMCYQRIS